MEFDAEIERGMTDYELAREKNKKEFEAMISQFTAEIDKSNNILKDFGLPRKPKKKKRGLVDTTFLFKSVVPLETRRSARLSNIPPEYIYEDLIDDDNHYNSDIENLEKVVFRKRKAFTRKGHTPSTFLSVEEITDKYLDNIAMRVVDKTYCSSTGTSCHQCRQKTTDSKTYCRSGCCIGVRGQFCGVCLKNRYGEDARTVLLDPNWKCPPCRNLCNCSICRTREGKRPTGILAPLAFQHGHKSVKDFLISLKDEEEHIDKLFMYKEENDSSESNNKNKHDNDFLIGFNQDLLPLWISKNKSATLHEEGSLVGFNIDKEPIMIKVTPL